MKSSPLKAAGIHIIHVIWPALFLGIVTSLITFGLYLSVIPYTQYLPANPGGRRCRRSHVWHARERRVHQASEAKLRDPCQEHAGQKLYDVLFMRRTADNQSFDLIVKAREAELHVVKSERRSRSPRGKRKSSGTVDIFDFERTWPIDLPADFPNNANKNRAMDMTWLELDEFEAKNPS